MKDSSSSFEMEVYYDKMESIIKETFEVAGSVNGILYNIIISSKVRTQRLFKNSSWFHYTYRTKLMKILCMLKRECKMRICSSPEYLWQSVYPLTPYLQSYLILSLYCCMCWGLLRLAFPFWLYISKVSFDLRTRYKMKIMNIINSAV